MFFFYIAIYWGGTLIDLGGYMGTRLQNAWLLVNSLLEISDLTYLYSNLQGVMEDGSSILRIGSSYANFKINFPNGYLLGIGLGNSSSFSYTSNLIVDLGLLGTVLYIKLFAFEKQYNLHYIIACVIFFLCNLFTSVTQIFGVDVLVIFYLLRCLYVDLPECNR